MKYAVLLAALAVAAMALAGCASNRGAAGGQGQPTPAASPHSQSTPAASPHSQSTGSTQPQSEPQSLFPPASKGEQGHLQPGSNPSVLPGAVLIADRDNNRLIVVDPQGRVIWQFPQPGDLQPGQQFLSPDDAFFTPDGKQIIATHELDFFVTIIDIASRRIVWQYGHPGVPGSAPGYLWNPDDAVVLPDGNVLLADIKNCRILLIAKGSHQVLRSFGQPGQCVHNPPETFGSPNGTFPMSNGNYLITEINGDWVDELTPDGRVIFSTNPPDVNYPSDSNEVSPGRYLTADYSSPGKIVLFDRTGKALWTFEPSGPNMLDHPSLALPLPNGDVISTDDRNDRIIVVDPSSNQIVWQYGQTGVPGASPGLLNTPDGLDMVPPNSLMIRHHTTNGKPG